MTSHVPSSFDEGRTDGGDEKKERDARDNEEGRDAKEKIPLLTEQKEAIILTPVMEEEILGPESFTIFGIGRWRSAGLQKLARPETYLAAFSLAAFAQGIFFTYSTGTLTTVERRFKLPSSVSGFISTGNDVLQVFLSLPLAFVAGYGHRPRWLSGGIFLSTIGSFIIMSPHIIFGAGDYSSLAMGHADLVNSSSNINKEWEYCNKADETEGDCAEGRTAVGTEQYLVAALQFLGQVMSGIANVCFYVVGFSYLDEAVSKDKVPLYFAVSGCMRIFGPVVGTALASYTVSLWVDPTVEPFIKKNHPQWVGAWWLGYPIIMAAMLISTIPMMMMPRQLPGARERTRVRLRAAARQGKEAFASYRESLRPLGKVQYKDMFSGLARLSKNKIFVLITTNQTVFWFGIVGYYMFHLKYMENQFKISASESNRVVALAGIIASLIGWLGMGSLLTFVKPSSKTILWVTMTISLLCMASYAAQMSITCERDHIVGLEAVLESEGAEKDFYSEKDEPGVSTCMANCGCSSKYSPVCANDTHLFFSACHAGCTKQLTINGSLAYEGCMCTKLLTPKNTEVDGKVPLEVSSGVCSTSCNSFLYYICFKILTSMLVSSNRAIANILIFRSLNERDKDLALGVLNVILSVAFTLVPIMIGTLIDYSCILWQRTCGRRGYCYLYNLDKYRWIIHGVPVGGMILSFITESLILRHHKEVDFFGQKEMEELELLKILKSKVTGKKKKDPKGKPDASVEMP
ncbi:solute carrier organic anion transporter family member 74D-like isoform X1 [Macrobrachium nipponense]|uniref:solute carrier organic anion transporter family member 74D-like isoform X1 n=1 Tax=Macrobrachium nipponense TaxID=159736 RepID=UPI0030C7BD25